MYDKSIDVAEIMRKIKSEVMPEDVYTSKSSSKTPQILADSINEINRIHSFLINTRSNMELHKVIGYNVPKFDRFPLLVRKLLRLTARIISKTTRFITREQNIVNDDISAFLKAVVESEQQIIKALSYMDLLSNQNRELENKNMESLKKIAALENKNEVLSKQLIEVVGKIENIDTNIEDKLYLGFEDNFRGSNDEIRKRLSYYINNFILNHVDKESNKIIIDIGCGRGEWLDILQQSGYDAIGIDSNASMASYCKEKGLEVIHEDAIKYLKTLKDKSVKLLTCFQVVEHLYFNQLNELVEEISRVLDDNGMVIIETPNAHNLEVGSCNFYIDPTHKKQIHPHLLEFLAQEKKISKTQIVHWKNEEIDQWWKSVVEGDETDIFDSPSFRTIAASIKGVLYNSPDYALIGIKNSDLE